MSWRSAFLMQARSDNGVRQQLSRSGVEYAHQLHYLQMTSEKLAKALLTPDSANRPPVRTHSAFVYALRLIKGRRDLRRLLGFQTLGQMRAAIDSLLPLADRVERLAPALNHNGPNPEYPWQATDTGPVIAPVQHKFLEFDPRSPQMAKLLDLLNRLLLVIE